MRGGKILVIARCICNVCVCTCEDTFEVLMASCAPIVFASRRIVPFESNPNVQLPNDFANVAHGCMLATDLQSVFYSK